MQITHYQVWFIVAAALAVVEMVSGTFYLFLLALAAFGAGLAAWWGLSASVQIGVMAIIAAIGYVGIRRLKPVRREEETSLDVGNRVEWLGTTPAGYWRVRYRGTEWQATPETSGTSPEKPLIVGKVKGNVLIVKNLPSVHPGHGDGE